MYRKITIAAIFCCIVSNSVYAQTYCTPNFSGQYGNSFEFISKFTLSLGQNSAPFFINDSSQSNSAYSIYEDFTSRVIVLSSGNTYQASIYPGFSKLPWRENYTIWIDFNKDGDFASNERILTMGSVDGTATASFTLSGAIQGGTTRMRIAQRFIDTPIPCPALGSSNGSLYNYLYYHLGQIEDYTIRSMIVNPDEPL
jgi:hypothetical protein